MITNGQVAIGTVAAAIDGVWHNPSRITIHNADNTQSIFIGGNGVTTTTGLTIEKLQTLQFDLQPLEQIYAVSTKENHYLHWMRQTI